METEDIIRSKYRTLSPAMNERSRRLWAATEAIALGRGGIALVLRATGLAFNTVYRGMGELDRKEFLPPDRVRRPGGGRKKATALNPGLSRALDRLVEPLLAPIRKVVPLVGMFDFSPLVLIILVQLMENVLINILNSLR